MRFQSKFNGNIYLNISNLASQNSHKFIFTIDHCFKINLSDQLFLNRLQSSFGGRVDFDFSNLRTETMQQWLGFLSPDAISLELEGSLLQRATPDLASDPSLQTFVRNVFVQGLSSIEDPLR